MAYYSNWYKQKVNCSSEGALSTSSITLLTPAQVTVSSVRDRLVYNIEYKQNPEENDHKPSERRRTRQSTVSSTTSTFAAANVVAGKFQNHQRNHTRRHTRKSSSESDSSFVSNLSVLSDISEDCMWDDWIVKYLDKKDVAVDDAQMEDWIFETM